MAMVRVKPSKARREERSTIWRMPEWSTRRRRTTGGTARKKPRAAGKRGPLRSTYMPMKGAEKLGRTKGRKMSPAPKEFQPKRFATRRGRVASQLVMSRDCAREHHIADRRRREERRVRAGGIKRLMEGCTTDEAAVSSPDGLCNCEFVKVADRSFEAWIPSSRDALATVVSAGGSSATAHCRAIFFSIRSKRKMISRTIMPNER